MRLVEFVLYALAFGLFYFFLNVVHVFKDVDPFNDFNVVQVVDSTYYYCIRISSHVKERLQLRLNVVGLSIHSNRLVLLANHFLNQKVIIEDFFDFTEAVWLEV